MSKCVRRTEYQKAIAVVRRKLGRNVDLYRGFQDNIAMAFKDESYRQQSRDSAATTHRIANQAAMNFLDLLISKPRIK